MKGRQGVYIASPSRNYACILSGVTLFSPSANYRHHILSFSSLPLSAYTTVSKPMPFPASCHIKLLVLYVLFFCACNALL
ncbi:hypothetical protein BDZ91DRAFT_724742 [Kalaharituber pfeilii]|nr:hypothetical protein BDZ91DRAFT_724742 [Kalaharituber pfeilii]